MQALKSAKNSYTHNLRARDDKSEPFFIIGSGRSGNTLLRRILTSHKELHIPPETYVLKKVTRNFRRSRALDWCDLVYLTFSQFEFHPAFDTFQMDLKPLIKTLVNAPKEQKNLAHLLDSFYRYHASLNGKFPLKWGDKTPLNTFGLDEIDSVFPRAKYIHIVRDGYDVIASYVKSGIYQDSVSAAYRWRNSTIRAGNFGKKRPTRFMEVKYEDLVRYPENTVTDICVFLGLTFYQNILEPSDSPQSLGDITRRRHHQNVNAPISTASIGKGRIEIWKGDTHLQELAIIVNRQMKKYGYENLKVALDRDENHRCFR